MRSDIHCTAQYLSRVGGEKPSYRKCNLDEDSQRVAQRLAENVAVRGCYAVAIVAILQPVPLSGYNSN
jgi:hypothetical protein